MPNIPQFLPSWGAIANVTPFTHRDNATYLTMLHDLSHYLTFTLIPTINEEFSEQRVASTGAVVDLLVQVNALIETLNTTNTSAEDALLEMQNIQAQLPNLTTLISDAEGYANSAQLSSDNAAAAVVTINTSIDDLPTPLGVNVLDYGAVGDGVADDSDAIIAALLASKNVFMPTGVYIVSKTIVVGSNGKLFGEGGKNAATIKASALFNTGTYNSIVKLTGFHPLLERIQINGVNTPGADAIRIESDYEPNLSNVKVNGGKIGVNLISGLESRFSNVSVINTTESGFYIQNVPDCFLINCSTDNCDFGLRADGGSITAIHFHAIKSVKHGFYLVGPGSSQFYGCHADTNGQNGFHILNASNARFTDCWSFKNSALSVGAYHNWHINGASYTSIVGGGSTFETDALTSFNFAGVQNGLSLIACHATKGVQGDLVGVSFVSPTGDLAKLSTSPGVVGSNLSLTAGQSGTFKYFLPYTPTMGYNSKLYEIKFNGRGSTENKVVAGSIHWADTGNTAGGGFTAKTFLFGAASDAGGTFTLTVVRNANVLTFTLLNNSTQEVNYGVQVEEIRGAKH